MRHLSDIDAQLGLAPYDNFSDADGRGAAKAALAAGIAACGLKHPFSKSKRQACVEEKKRIYAAKISAIDGVVGSQYATKEEPTGTAMMTPREVMPKSIPQSVMPESPAKLRANESAAQAAEAEAAAEGGMSTNTKILIGVGAAVVLIGGFLYFRKK